MTEKLFIADPYNEDHISLFKEFETRNNFNNKTSTVLENIKNNYTKEQYEEALKDKNIINEYLFLEDKGYMKDYCFINAEKDRKSTTLELPIFEDAPKNRTIISMATDYSFNVLGMQTVAVITDLNNKKLIENLEKKSFENLGEENGKIIFVKENEIEKEQGMIRHGNI